MNHDADFTDEQLLLTTVQADRVLCVGRTTVYQLIKTGELHAVHVGGSCRISWAELERYDTRLDAVEQPAAACVCTRGAGGDGSSTRPAAAPTSTVMRTADARNASLLGVVREMPNVDGRPARRSRRGR